MRLYSAGAFAELLGYQCRVASTFGRSPHEIWCEEGPTARVLTL